MSANVESLTMELLRALRGDMGALRDDMQETKVRLTTLESVVTSQHCANPLSS